MVRIQCPFCERSDIDYSHAYDAVLWTDEDAGAIVTSELRCRDPKCKGHKGFTATFGFITGDYVEYSGI